MSNRGRAALAVVLAAALAGWGWHIWSKRQTEPVYQGKSLRAWVAACDDLSNRHGPEWQRAAAVVRAAGTNALPTLLRMLQTRDSGPGSRLAEWLQNQHLFRVNYVTAANEQLQAVAGFRVLGAEARDAVPGLIKIYERGISPSSQSAAAEALVCIGPAAREAVPVLLSGTSNSDRTVRWTTLSALCQLQVEPTVLVPALIKSLGDSYAPVQRTAIQALGELSTDARPAVPALVGLLEQHDPGLRYLVREALKRIDPEAANQAGLKE